MLRIALGAPFGAAVLSGFPAWAASREFWDAKPSSEWNSSEIERILTKSPWAKDVNVSYNGGQGGSNGGRGGGGSRRGSGGGGIGFPGGGGIGFPGGGRTGGGGYPGGGGGYPGGGGGYPGGGGGYPGGGGDGRSREAFHGTLRWESALPIQEALRIDAADGKPNPDFTKYYVLHLLGDFPAMGRRQNRDDGDTRRRDDDSNDRDDDVQAERRQEMFKDTTRLERKDGFIRVEKVEEGSRVGNLGPGTFFYFSRLDDISMDDKQVQFVTKIGPVEIKAKFVLKEMVYHGKLSI
jgi:hypothetical protein